MMQSNMQAKIKDNLHHATEAVKDNLHNAKENLQATRADVLAARKCENINDPVDTHFVDYVGMAWSKLFIALHVIPNVITMLSGLSGIAGGVLLALNRSVGLDVIGAVLVFLSAVFDASDGQVARLTKHYSRLGRMLDGAADASVYATLYTACVCRLWNTSLFAGSALRHALLIALGVLTYVLYVAQCQLPDYFKNLHMYMIDNSHGNELSRGKHIRAERKTAKGFGCFSLFCYSFYTGAPERRAPRTQKLLDAIEAHGKSEALCDAFYAESRKLVKLTNLLTFNLRTAVLLLCVFLHFELGALGFVILVLEPIRLILLRRYEKLSQRLLPMVESGQDAKRAVPV